VPHVQRTSSPAQTEAIGARLASRLRPGDLVLVSGEVGTGKTTLIRGALRALGVTEPVISPTFTIGRRYRGRVAVSHLDLFRLEGLGGEDPGLLDDYLAPDSIVFVEWPRSDEVFLGDARRVVVRVELEHAGGDRREIRVHQDEGSAR
jgi:tRNA threonylcarbamoyladenosine biosynthesis protein TsaE